MLLWRLSGVQHGRAMDGGYGLLFDGRWNTAGRAVTYCATSPALCVLEKLVHIEDPALLPDLVMVVYEVPDHVATDRLGAEDLPADWRHLEAWTQRRGDAWHERREALLLSVPSAVVPFRNSPDANFVINHEHPDAALIAIRDLLPFELDTRLL